MVLYNTVLRQLNQYASRQSGRKFSEIGLWSTRTAETYKPRGVIMDKYVNWIKDKVEDTDNYMKWLLVGFGIMGLGVIFYIIGTALNSGWI